MKKKWYKKCNILDVLKVTYLFPKYIKGPNDKYQIQYEEVYKMRKGYTGGFNCTCFVLDWVVNKWYSLYVRCTFYRIWNWDVSCNHLSFNGSISLQDKIMIPLTTCSILDVSEIWYYIVCTWFVTDAQIITDLI